MKENNIDLKEVKNVIKTLYKDDKEKVSDYLDYLKKKSGIKKHIAKSDNEFLKYM